MAVDDLRAWIERIDEMGQLSRVSGADPLHEIGGLVDMFQWDMEKPALLFDKIKGLDPSFRLLTNVFTSLPRINLSLDLPIDYSRREVVREWRDRLKTFEPQPAEIVEDGPVLENRQTGGEIDVTRFPAPVWHAQDGGAYLGTGNIVVMKDPDTGWINAGTYRIQVHDSKTLGIMISPGKHGRMIREKYWARGKACPVAVSFGHDPLLLLLGGLEVDYGVNEYDVAGGIRGESVKLVNAPLTGLPVPATSELVIEGEIPPDETHAEGPFGEWAGYHAGAYANRFVVVVDDDIDPTDTNEVLWAMCTRTDVIDDIDVMKRCWSTSLDPMSYAGEEGLRYYNNRMIIDACRPYDRLATFPEVVRTSDEDAARLRARWPELFNADGRAKRGPSSAAR